MLLSVSLYMSDMSSTLTLLHLVMQAMKPWSLTLLQPLSSRCTTDLDPSLLNPSPVRCFISVKFKYSILMKKDSLERASIPLSMRNFYISL